MKKEDWKELNTEVMIRDNYNSIGVLKEDMKFVKSDMKTIRENHLTHMETDISILKTDMKWIKKYHWIVVASGIGAVLSAVTTLVFMLISK